MDVPSPVFSQMPQHCASFYERSMVLDTPSQTITKHPLVFSEERFVEAWPEFKSLAEAHWQETEMYHHGEGFNPDLKRYDHFNDIGLYHLYTVRCHGKLIGNCGMYVMPSMHTGKVVATEDTWFLCPEFRAGRNAIRFHQYVASQMKELGAVSISMTTKLTNGAGRILEYLGYSHVANQYTKDL